MKVFLLVYGEELLKHFTKLLYRCVFVLRHRGSIDAQLRRGFFLGVTVHVYQNDALALSDGERGHGLFKITRQPAKQPLQFGLAKVAHGLRRVVEQPARRLFYRLESFTCCD